MEINVNQFINLWNKVKDPYGLYIHSPFCTNTCTFCAYRGIANQSATIINNYYQNLLQYLNLFMPYIKKHNPDVIYFGGGTPNLFPRQILEQVMNYFKDMPQTNIAVELSPSDCLDDLDVWTKNSDLIILGVQSFNENTLNSIKRKYVSYEKIKEIVNIIINSGCHCAIDLVADLYENDTWERFLNDFELAKTLNIDFVCLADNYKQRLHQDKIYNIAKSATNNVLLNKNSRSYIVNFTDYNPQNKIYRKYYYTPEKMSHSVLGIGAMSNQIHPTMSTLIINNERFDIQQLNWEQLKVYQPTTEYIDKDSLNYTNLIQELLTEQEAQDFIKE